jgi:hypothetical protein
VIKQGDIIKHKAFMDVAVQVIFASTNPENGEMEVSGIWINQGQLRTYSINEPAKFTIKKHQLDNWMKCLKPKSNFIRNEEWEQL